MSENTAWVIVLCCLIAFGSACEVMQGQQRVEKLKLELDAQKYCFDNGGEVRWWGSGCVLEKKK